VPFRVQIEHLAAVFTLYSLRKLRDRLLITNAFLVQLAGNQVVFKVGVGQLPALAYAVEYFKDLKP